MSAVIQTGGKQYRVNVGDVMKLEKLEGETGDKISFDQVMLISNGEKVSVGDPMVSGASVKGEIVSQGRRDKIEILKFRRRKHHMKHQGHRQYYTEVKITEIDQA